MSLNTLLEQVKDAVRNYAARQNGQPGNADPDALIRQIEDLFRHYQHQSRFPDGDEPQGMDPYGGLPDEAGRFEQGRVGE